MSNTQYTTNLTRDRLVGLDAVSKMDIDRLCLLHFEDGQEEEKIHLFGHHLVTIRRDGRRHNFVLDFVESEKNEFRNWDKVVETLDGVNFETFEQAKIALGLVVADCQVS